LDAFGDDVAPFETGFTGKLRWASGDSAMLSLSFVVITTSPKYPSRADAYNGETS